MMPVCKREVTEMRDDIKAVAVKITGRVQGVGFRDWTMTEAQRLGLRGWVRNDADGSVTAYLAGPRAAVDEMLMRLEDGPALASVSSVEVRTADFADADATFRIVG